MNASWQAFYAHLCAASIIRAMPETEIPPAMRGDLYSYSGIMSFEKNTFAYMVFVLLLPFVPMYPAFIVAALTRRGYIIFRISQCDY